MKNIDYSNQIQKEAILNECKGNLFEFLVAQGLASCSLVEDQFLLNLPTEFKMKLGQYEELMRTYCPELLKRLPVLASLTVKSIWDKVILEQYIFLEWKVIGKIVSSNDNEVWNETDIVGSYINKVGMQKHLSFSLKLSKDNSYTNTKSAGVKSFITKYFASFGQISQNFQNELNCEVDESFLAMGHRLYSSIDKEFTGSFGMEWSDAYTELPGELSPELRKFVHSNYHRIALKLSSILTHLKEVNDSLFFDALATLCGFGHTEIIQVCCFHQEYEFKKVTIKNFEDYFSNINRECELLPIKELGSSVEIVLGNLLLQIRVKPMNKFTTAAYKINCSIKVKT